MYRKRYAILAKVLVISTYYTKVKKLWDELDDFPPHACSSAEKILKKRTEQEALAILDGA